MSENRRQNVLYVLKHWPDPGANLAAIAGAIGVNTSTLNRWQNGKANPTDAKIRQIAKAITIDPALFDQPHREFISSLDSKQAYLSAGNLERRVVLRTIAKWKHMWQETFERHRGSYYVYNRLTKFSRSEDEVSRIAVSLLTIDALTAHGIEFEISNFDNRHRETTGAVNRYKYNGLMFPVWDTLCFYGEEQTGDEPLFLLTGSSQTSPPSMLSGYLSAIAVNEQLRLAYGARVLLTFKSRKRIAAASVENDIGVFPESQIRAELRERL